MIRAPAGHEIDWSVAGAACVAVAVVASSNALFAYSLGAVVTWRGVSIDGAILAAGAVALAVCQAQSATQFVRGGVSRWISGPFLVICLCYSVGAMAAHVSKLQRLQEDARNDENKDFRIARDALADATKNRDAIRADLEPVAGARSQAQIKTALEQVQLSASEARTFRKSSECTAQWAQDEAACAPFRALRTELGEAIKAEELRPKLEAAEAAVRSARSTLAASRAPAEPGVVERVVRQWLVWAFAVALEAAETFGFALAIRKRKPAAPNAPDRGREDPPEPEPLPPGAATPEAVLMLLQQVRAGALPLKGATVDGSGRVVVGQRIAAETLRTSPTTINKRLAELETRGAIRRHGRAIEIVQRPPALGVVSSHP